MSNLNHSLIVRLPNWVGDVIMALPALQALQQGGVQLKVLGKPWIQDLLSATDLALFSLADGFWQNKKKMAAITASHRALLFTNSFSSALMSFLAGKASIGYPTDGRQCFLKAGPVKLPHQHEVDYFWRLAQFAAQYWFPALTWPSQIPEKITLPIGLDAISRAKQALQNAKINEPFWVLCPFAHGKGAVGASKIWPHWYELSEYLQQEHRLVVCPGEREVSLCASLVPKASILPGLGLSEYAAILSMAERVIANDSGPMHLAAAVGAETLGIFGATDPVRTHPWGAAYIGQYWHWPTCSEVLGALHLDAFRQDGG